MTSTTRSLYTLKRLSSHSGRAWCTPSAPPGTPVHGAGALSASVTFTPPVCRRARTMSTMRSATGAILDEPKRESRFGMLKVFLTVMTGLSIGAWVSQKMAAFLEENELFVPEDDGDDDDDDDD